jgi:hypothetical protein
VNQKSVNLNYSLILMGMFRLKPVSKFVKRYYSVVSCAMNTRDIIGTILVNSVTNREINNLL